MNVFMNINVLDEKKVRPALQTLPVRIFTDVMNDLNRITHDLTPINPRKPMNVSIGKGVWCIMYKRKAKFAALFYVVNDAGLNILHVTHWHSSQKLKIDNQDISTAAAIYRQLQ